MGVSHTLVLLAQRRILQQPFGKMRPCTPPHRQQYRIKNKTGAFTLIEVALAALIIGLLAAIALPAFKRSVMAARSDAVMNDLRVFATAYQHYMQDKGEWPEDSGPGQMPAGMDGYLKGSNWSQSSPIGGFYNWEAQATHGGSKIRAAIAISGGGDNPVTTDRMQLEDIDRRFDDGNLSTGVFRLGFGLEPIYVIEP